MPYNDRRTVTMDGHFDISSIPPRLQQELRTRLAAIDSELARLGARLERESEPTARRAISEEIARLQRMARETVERYRAAASASAPPERAHAAPPVDGVARETRPLETADLQILFEIADDERPPTVAPRRYEAVASASPIDEYDVTFGFGTERGGLAHRSFGPGGRLGYALAFAAEAAAARDRSAGAARRLARPLETAVRTIERGAGEDEILGAVLHDAVSGPSDETALGEIREHFGEHVALIVASAASLRRIDPWEQRDRGWVSELAAAPPEAVRVAMTSRLCGLDALARRCRVEGAATLGGDERAIERLFWSLRTLGKAFRVEAAGGLADEWDRAVAELERAARRS